MKDYQQFINGLNKVQKGDVHLLVMQQAIELDSKIMKLIEDDEAEHNMSIEINGEQMYFGLWHADVCHILLTALADIAEFAKNELPE